MGFWKMIIRGFTTGGGVGNVNTHMQDFVNTLQDQGHAVHNAQTVPVEDPSERPATDPTPTSATPGVSEAEYKSTTPGAPPAP